MRRFLFSVLFIGLFAGCSAPKISPYRIDVQQGNALDQENVSRLKTGLSRSQVRFLLGTPLVVDPFRADRWDYVYVYYKAGKLAEQRRLSLFFEGDTLVRIDGDLPQAAPAAEPPAPASKIAAPTVEPAPLPEPLPLEATPLHSPDETAGVHPAAAGIPPPVQSESPVVSADAIPRAEAAPPASTDAVVSQEPSAPHASGIVPPLPSPRNVPAYVDPRPPAEPSSGMVVETDVERVRPDVIPPFPEPNAAVSADEVVLKAVSDWANAWSARNEDAYLAAYDAGFVPQGGGSRVDWEKRRRLLLGVARHIDLKIDSPSVDRADDGSATVTFNQLYRSDSYRDAVVKQLRLVERDGRWLIVEEKVLSILRGMQP